MNYRKWTFYIWILPFYTYFPKPFLSKIYITLLSKNVWCILENSRLKKWFISSEVSISVSMNSFDSEEKKLWTIKKSWNNVPVDQYLLLLHHLQEKNGFSLLLLDDSIQLGHFYCKTMIEWIYSYKSFNVFCLRNEKKNLDR